MVSAVICNYNYGGFLREALNSALDQSYANVEVVVVDDGSTDNSKKILAEYQDQIICVHTERVGQTMALSAGAGASHGEIICFLDSDDVWSRTKVAEVVKVFHSNPQVGWVRHKLAVADSGLQPIGAIVPQFTGSKVIAGNPLLYLERVVTASTSALSIRREVVVRLFKRLERLIGEGGSLAGGLNYDADAYLLALIGASSGEGFSLDGVLGYYRRHGGQQFSGSAGVLSMIVRQIEVDRTVSCLWSSEMGKTAVASPVHKHQLLVEALHGRAKWSPKRLRVLLSGLGVVANLMRADRRLAFRQAGGLLYAFLAPKAWLRRVLLRHGYWTEP